MNLLDSLPSRRDTWAATAQHCSVSYRLRLEVDADSLCRVINLFALQGLTPHDLQVVRDDDWLQMHLGVDGLSWHRAQVIEQKLGNLVCVDSVSLQSTPMLAQLAQV